MNQPALFAYPPTRGTSRRNDPRTSKDAAKSMSADVLNQQQRVVLAAVGDDATAYEIVVALAARGRMIQQNVVARRLTDLRKRGFVVATGGTRPGSSARELTVYEVTPSGRSWLEGEGS